jgi:glycerate dehydrogenase
MKLVFLDAATMGDDLDLSVFSQFGSLEIFDNTLPEEVISRIRDVDIVLVNKVKYDKTSMDMATNLKLILLQPPEWTLSIWNMQGKKAFR